MTDPAERAKCLDIIDQELTRLDGLVGKLIELSKLESGRSRSSAPVRVADLVNDALGVLRGGARRRDASTSRRRSSPTSRSPAIARRWSRSGEPAQQRLEVHARRRAQDRHPRPRRPAHVDIAVTDNGPGVPEEERRRIFEKFERGRAASRAAPPASGSASPSCARSCGRTAAGSSSTTTPAAARSSASPAPLRAGPLAAVTARAHERRARHDDERPHGGPHRRGRRRDRRRAGAQPQARGLRADPRRRRRDGAVAPRRRDATSPRPARHLAARARAASRSSPSSAAPATTCR